jgi:PhnB protein
MKAKPIPVGYEGATPYLYCRNAAAALKFYKKAFGAKERMRMEMPGGKIGHAEIKIGGANIMLADEFPDMGVLGPQSIGGSPVTVLIYVTDVDALVARAVAAGVKVVNPLADQFYGDRNCKMTDPFGHSWMFATRKEDLSPEEMQKRADALFAKK